MNLYLDYTKHKSFDKKITLPGSKSESNRLLILQQIYPNLKLNNLATADDTVLLKNGLSSSKKTINIGHAGTTMRFLTAYFSTKKDTKVILTGSKRMLERPLKILVEALQKLGANITYLKEKGFPPIEINGTTITKNTVEINGNVSSQYISALLLIAPSLKNGLILKLKGKVTSVPYIEMTLSLLNEIGIETKWIENTITIHPKKTIKTKTISVESDWSAVSYYYSLVALSDNGKLNLSYFKENSLQGDSQLAKIYTQFGVKTTFKNEGIILEKVADFKQKQQLTFDLANTPDIAQTIAVTCFGLGISCGLTGLHTLKIKETDRLEALKIELKKLGAEIRVTNESLHLKSQESRVKKQDQRAKTKEQEPIQTYNDHRMAMAFAPLAILFPITINDADVVSKSYPEFWEDLACVLK